MKGTGGDNHMETQTQYTTIKAKIEKVSRSKIDRDKETILLLNIKDSENNIIREHSWIPFSKRIKRALKNGNYIGREVEFTARLEEYFSFDLINKTKLKHIRNIKLI